MRMTSATSQGGRVTKIYPSTAAVVPAYESRVDRAGQSPSAGDGARGANRRRYVPDAHAPAAAEWFADRFQASMWCVAKLWRRVCGPIFFWMPARTAASLQIFQTVLSEMACS